MNKEQQKLVDEVAEIDEAWHEADGETRSALKAKREDILARSDVAEALGEQAKERQAAAEAEQAKAALSTRAVAGFTESKHLVAGEQAIYGKLDALAESEGDEMIHAIRDRIDKIRHEPAFAFIVGAVAKGAK